MTRLSFAFAKDRPALECFIATGHDKVLSNPEAPADASAVKV